jgi:hypothetical protein
MLLLDSYRPSRLRMVLMQRRSLRALTLFCVASFQGVLNRSPRARLPPMNWLPPALAETRNPRKRVCALVKVGATNPRSAGESGEGHGVTRLQQGDYVLHIEGMFRNARSKGQSEQTVSHAQKRVCRTLSTGFQELPRGTDVVALTSCNVHQARTAQMTD